MAHLGGRTRRSGHLKQVERSLGLTVSPPYCLRTSSRSYVLPFSHTQVSLSTSRIMVFVWFVSKRHFDWHCWLRSFTVNENPTSMQVASSVVQNPKSRRTVLATTSQQHFSSIDRHNIPWFTALFRVIPHQSAAMFVLTDAVQDIPF